MAAAILITNPEQSTYFIAENIRRIAEEVDRLAKAARRTARDIATAANIAIQTAQLVTYYNLADDAIDARDDIIDKEIACLQDLEDYKINQDLGMAITKSTVLTNLNLPDVDMCSDAINNLTKDLSEQDGDAVDLKTQQISGVDLPPTWGTHHGTLMAAKASGYNGGIIANSAKRRLESFRTRKTDLVRAGQQGMKAVYNATDTLTKYTQAAAIHSGLADLFMQGFNSAGAGLGVAIGRLSGAGES